MDSNVVKSHNLRAVFVLLVLVSTFLTFSSPAFRLNERLSQLIYGQHKYMPEILCQKRVSLPYFEEEYSSTNQQLFFIEPSFDERLFPGRKVCAIESAILNSQLPVKVVFTADQLHFGNASSFCRLVEAYYPDRLQLFTIDVGQLFQATPLVATLPLWEKSLADTPKELGIGGMVSKYNQLSDLLRYAVLYQFGGFYLDFDVLVLQSLFSQRNFLAIETNSTIKPTKCSLPAGSESSPRVNGGVLHMNAGSPLIWKVMQLCKERLMLASTVENSGNSSKSEKGKKVVKNKEYYQYDLFGPPLLAEAVRYFLSLPAKSNITNGIYEGFTIEPVFKFMPVLRPGLTLFGQKAAQKSSKDWEETFRCSLTVHLLGPLSKLFPVITPRSSSLTKHSKFKLTNYSLGFDVYSYLGPKVCPKSFSSLRMFELF